MADIVIGAGDRLAADRAFRETQRDLQPSGAIVAVIMPTGQPRLDGSLLFRDIDERYFKRLDQEGIVFEIVGRTAAQAQIASGSGGRR
jgi:hypothetical protein